MKETYIIVKNTTHSNLCNVLGDFVHKNAQRNETIALQLFNHKEHGNSFLITFTEQPDLFLFAFLVHYLNELEEVQNEKPFIRGYIHSDTIQGNYEFKNSTYLMAFVSKNKTNSDAISIVTNHNDTFLLDFSDTVKKTIVEEKYIIPSLDWSIYQHDLDIIPMENAIKMRVKPWWKFW